MLYPLNEPDFKESGYDCFSPLATDSLPPSGYLVRSNLPNLSLEIEDPDTEFPLVSFDFKAS